MYELHWYLQSVQQPTTTKPFVPNKLGQSKEFGICTIGKVKNLENMKEKSIERCSNHHPGKKKGSYGNSQENKDKSKQRDGTQLMRMWVLLCNSYICEPKNIFTPNRISLHHSPKS